MVIKKVQTALLFTNDEPTKVGLTNEQTGNNISIDSGGHGVKKVEKNSTSSQTFVEQTLNVKEKYNVSNEAYQEMAMINSKMPCLTTLQNEEEEEKKKNSQSFW